MKPSHPTILTTAPDDIQRAVALLKQGELVAFPTETVYGLGADARNGDAVASIYEAKGRPAFNPLIVHVSDKAQAQLYGHWSAEADLLADAFWPGPLSLVLPIKDGHQLSGLITAGLESVALRVPAHPAAQALLGAFAGPIAAPSANPSGRISPTTAEHVRLGLGSKLAAIIDDGICNVGLESTVIGLSGAATLLRPGGIPLEDLQAVLKTPIAAAAEGEISAPGQLLSHYAPKSNVRLKATEALGDEVLLGFGDMPCDLNLSAAGNLREAASHLFGHLHKLDATGRPIAVATIPEHGLGRAINDRLTRAASPK